MLPIYFIVYLHFSPLQFGILDGVSQGATIAALSFFAGVVADRWRRHKEVATVGYALSTFGKIALLAAGSAWALIAAILGLDRVGKGIRSAPRDAMISLVSSPEKLATSFAVHRGLDACGAIFGPLIAFVLIRLIPNGFNVVIMTSFCIGLIGLGLITLLVSSPSFNPAVGAARPLPRLAAGLWAKTKFRALVVIGGALGLFTASDGFVYLLLQRHTDSSPAILPFYAFLCAVAYSVFSVPVGRLADRWDRRKVFLGGYAVLGLIYGILLFPSLPNYAGFGLIALFGFYYAATDGVLVAMASATVEPELRTSGLALLNTATSVSRFFCSILFGLLWRFGTARLSLSVFLAGVCSAMVLSSFIFAKKDCGATCTKRALLVRVAQQRNV